MARRVAGEPLETVLGWAAFRGLRIGVAPGVFVPRRRTELVVEAARDLVRAGDVLVDLCCGTGAIAAALAAEVPGLDVRAADLDPVAVACARTNLPEAAVYLGDLTEALPRSLLGRVAVLTAHAPIVPTSALGLLPPEARDHEPGAALDGGADGLEVLRRVLRQAPEWLTPTGALVTPVAAGQVETVLVDAAARGLTGRVVTDAERDATVVVWRRRDG